MSRSYNNYENIISFSRASTATYRASNGYVQSAGVDSARTDYNENGELQGVLLEPQRTNLIYYSNDLSVSGWYKSGASVSNYTISSPEGTSSVSKIIEDTSNGVHVAGDGGFTLTSGSDYCFSAFLCASERSSARLVLFDGTTSFAAYFHLANASVGSLLNTSVAGIIPYANGWYRCYITITASDVTGNLSIRNCVDEDDTYTGDGSSGIYAWGAQLEPGRYPSSLIYTNGSATTRALDYCSLDTSSFKYSNSSGTIVTTIRSDDYEQYNQKLVSVGGSTGIELWYTPSGYIAVRDDTADATITDYVQSERGQYHRVAMSYSANSNVGGLSINGNTYAYSANVSTIPAVSEITINYEGTNNGTSGITYLKELSYYPRALSLDYINELTR